jgi:hypothetical protein
MSNDLIASLKRDVAALSTGVDDDTRAVAGSGAANKRISIKGSVFRKFSGGKEVAVVQDRNMNVIFVRMAHAPSRTYYKGAFVEGQKIAPLCWSNDAKTPDPAVKNPPAESCDKCPFSVKGSSHDGKSTACRISWRTAVVLPHDPDGDVMQLVLPGASVFGKEESGKWPFRAYVQMLAANNISAGRVVTKMEFDIRSASPRLQFSPVAAVPADMLDILQQQRDSKAAEDAVTLTVYQNDEAGTEQEEAPEAPAAFAPPNVAAAVESEPVLRTEAPKAAPAATGDVADIVKKWAKK